MKIFMGMMALAFTLGVCNAGHASEVFDQELVQTIFATDRHNDEFAKLGARAGFLDYCDRTDEAKDIIKTAANKAIAYAKALQLPTTMSEDSRRTLLTTYSLNIQGIIDGAKTATTHLVWLAVKNPEDKIELCSKI